MTFTLRSRALALSAALATLTLAFVALPAVTPDAPLSPASADSASCTGYGDFPNVLPGGIYPPSFVYRQDATVNAYIAGDWNVVPGAAEGEGVLVVGDDATFATGEGFFVGKVGVGSQVSAPAGSDMLTVGGDVTVSGAGSVLDVGPVLGGNLRAGGTITPALPSPSYTFNGGTGTAGAPGALTPFAAVPVYYTTLSAQLAALGTAGSTVDLSNPSEVHFVGDNTQSRQVFTVSGADLGTTIGGKDVHFDNMATDAVVVVNVTGTVAEMNTWRFYVDGVELDHDTAANRIFANWAQSIVWNFVDATDVTLGVNAQIPGSILIPTANSNLDLQSSVNGRLFVNGDVTFGGGGSSGIELHSYGLRTCSLAPISGTFTIGKSISDPDAVTSATRFYTGTYSCVDGLGAVVDDGTWSLQAGDTVTVSGLPAGTECSAAEDAATLAASPGGDPTYTWGAPTYSAATVTVVGGADVAITVTNVVLHDVGSLAITKNVTDPNSVVSALREFTGTYSCSNSVPVVVASGTWSLASGATTTVNGIPTGAVCSVTENASTLTAAPSTDPTYSWGAATYSSASVSIATGATRTITVTNVVERHWGSLAVTKALTDPDSVVTAGRMFAGTWACVDGGTSAALMNGTWSVAAGAAPYVVDFIPVGAVCSVAENALTVAPSPTDPSYRWEAPTYSSASVTIADATASGIVVRNAVAQGLGDLEMIKILDDPYNVVNLSRVYTGTWSCSFNAAVIDSGTWSTTAGAPAVTLATDLPVGSVCTLAEDSSTLAAPPLAGYPQYIWQAPVITPSTVTIQDGVLHRFTVTNIVYDPITALAHAGTDSMRWMLGGSAIAAAGILLVYIARRRRLA